MIFHAWDTASIEVSTSNFLYFDALGHSKPNLVDLQYVACLCFTNCDMQIMVVIISSGIVPLVDIFRIHNHALCVLGANQVNVKKRCKSCDTS